MTAFLKRYALLIVIAAIVLVTIVLPLASIVFQSIFKLGPDGIALTGEFLAEVLGNQRYWVFLGNTAAVSLGSALIATVLGVALAWILTRSNIPRAALLERLAVAPIFLPPFIGAFAWILLAAPRTGLINLAFVRMGLPEPLDIYSYGGMFWVIGIYVAPYVLMIVASALRSMDPSLEEAAQVAGLSRLRTALTVTLPIVAPAILSGGILAFVIAIGLFGTPVLLGLSKQIWLVTTRIYIELQQFPPGYGVVAVLALYLVILSALANLLQQVLLRGRSFVTVTGKGFQPRLIQLRGSRYLLAGFVLLYVLLTMVAPCGVVLAAAVSTYVWSGIFTWQNLAFLVKSTDVYDTLGNSLLITIIAATVATAFGIGIAWLVTRTTLVGRNVIEYLVLLPVSVPSLAFGVGVALLWLHLPYSIYGTMWIIIVAFIGKYVSYAVRSVRASLIQIHPELEESARISGYGWVRTLARITLPLVRPSIVSSWVMLYSIFITELSIVLTLYTAETRTFSILSFETWSVGQFSRVAALSILQLVLGSLIFYLASLGSRPKTVAAA